MDIKKDSATDTGANSSYILDNEHGKAKQVGGTSHELCRPVPQMPCCRPLLEAAAWFLGSAATRLPSSAIRVLRCSQQAGRLQAGRVQPKPGPKGALLAPEPPPPPPRYGLQGLVELPALPFSKIQYMIEYPSKPSQVGA